MLEIVFSGQNKSGYSTFFLFLLVSIFYRIKLELKELNNRAVGPVGPIKP